MGFDYHRRVRALGLLPALALLLAIACLIPASIARAQADPPERFDFTAFTDQIDAWLERYHDPKFDYDPHDIKGRFSYQPGKDYDLYGSTDAVYLIWSLGELEQRTTPEGRREWAKLIQSFQDPETGWFDRGNETLHFKAHATAYATGALALLGYAPTYPFKWKEPIVADEAALDRWLSGIWWDLVWVGSHSGGGIAASLEMTDQAPDEWFDWYFAWLDREVNPDTGVWQRAFFNVFTKKPNMHDLGGAAHFWWIYQQKGRDIPYPERVIDTVLGLQLESGLWDHKLIKGDFPYCINCDAVNGVKLAHLAIQKSGKEYRKQDIDESFARFMRCCEKVLNEPGAVLRLYGDNSHDLPGAVIGLAEADTYFQLDGGESRLITRNPWRSVLDVICWL